MSIIQISKIQQRSGNLVDLPQLDEAEFGWASDVKKLYIGKTVPNENVEVLTSYSQISFSQIDGSVGNLNISNVTVEDGQVLAFDGTNWVNKGGVAGGLLTLGDVGNVRLDGGAIGYVLETDGTGNLTWSPKSAIVAYIENVTIGNGSPGNLTLITTTEDNYFIQGAEVTITGVIGTTQLNGNSYYVALETANTFALYTDSTLVTPLNATGYGAFPYTTVSATNGITNYITVADSTNFTTNDPVVFDGNLGNSTLTAGRVYYIKTIPSGTTVTVSETAGGTILDPGTATGLSVKLYASGGRLIASIATGTASGTASGSNTSIQYNKNNFFAGSADFTYNETAKRLTVNGNANVGNLNATGTVTSSRLTSNIATGTAPLTVASTTRVANLNVERANVADNGYVNTKSTGTFYPVLVSGNTAANYELASNVNLTFNAATGLLTTTGANITGNLSANNANVGNILNVGANANIGGNLNVTGNIALTANLSGDSITLLNTLLVGPNTYITNSYMSLGNTDFANGAPYTDLSDTYVAVQDGVGATARYAGIGAATGLQYSNASFTGYMNHLGMVVSDTTLNSYVNAYANGVISTQSNNGSSLNLSNTSLSWYTLAGNGFIANAAGLYHTDKVQSPQLISTVATGTAPLVVTSTTQVANLNVANAGYATNAGTATVAGTVTTNSQPNITSVGTLTSLSVSGNISGGNISTSGNISVGNLSTGVLAVTGNASFTGANVSLGAVGNVKITGGTSGFVIVTDGTGNLTFANPTTVGTQPAGSDTQVQFNDSGSLGATSGFTFNKSTSVLQVSGNVSTAARLISTIATGSAPLVVNSTTRVANLNVANAGYADSAGSASTATNADYATSAGSAGSVAWTNVSGRPTQVSAFTNDSGYITSAFPAGTRMLFAQSTAPTGWTKDTTTSLNDSALRIVTGGAGSGGSVGFSAAFTSQSVSGSVGSTAAGGTISDTSVSGTVGSTTLTIDQIPPHSHSIPQFNNVSGLDHDGSLETDRSMLINATQTSGSTGGGQGHTHTFFSPSHGHSFSGASHSHSFSGSSINLAVKYVDVIIATKN